MIKIFSEKSCLEIGLHLRERKRKICQLVVILATRECGSVEMASLDLSPLQTNLKRKPRKKNVLKLFQNIFLSNFDKFQCDCYLIYVFFLSPLQTNLKRKPKREKNFEEKKNLFITTADESQEEAKERKIVLRRKNVLRRKIVLRRKKFSFICLTNPKQQVDQSQQAPPPVR